MNNLMAFKIEVEGEKEFKAAVERFRRENGVGAAEALKLTNQALLNAFSGATKVAMTGKGDRPTKSNGIRPIAKRQITPREYTTNGNLAPILVWSVYSAPSKRWRNLPILKFPAQKFTVEGEILRPVSAAYVKKNAPRVAIPNRYLAKKTWWKGFVKSPKAKGAGKVKDVPADGKTSSIAGRSIGIDSHLSGIAEERQFIAVENKLRYARAALRDGEHGVDDLFHRARRWLEEYFERMAKRAVKEIHD